MNFYPFHLGDYASHTRHLSLLEDLAYRRMLDLYYTTEAALPADPEKVARLIGMREYMREVADVLSDFFVISDAGHTNSRCEEELALYRAKADRAKSANKARWGGARAGLVAEPDEEFEQIGIGKTLHANAPPLKSETRSETKLQTAQIATSNHEPVTRNDKPVNSQPIKKTKPKSKAAVTPQQCDEYFEYAWEDYPKTSACTRIAAYQAWNARLAEGASPVHMFHGASCYRSYVEDKQVELDAVMHASVFFGPEQHYLRDWEARPLWTNEETYFDEEEY
ncbi:YdaU family protein [Undibacterium sp. Tian12W]|uniref:YdaU family protein n=1 Tax=Undibacterium sp. Tian12W TaxID=3413054 RepID=UPI003BF19BA2